MEIEKYLIILLILLVLGALYLIIFFITDSIITKKKLKKNQKAWDKYSKGMNNNEKLFAFAEWLETQKTKNNEKFYYIPRINLKPIGSESEGKK